ncbi:MAG: monovalent cation:proton antiporter-2 (CPA2) family protein [Thermoanaerobaculia bacterium]|nr:monovalent cation:proton antiporter-2 (CPA2) family protein [Thermoanaerobaculia bacterium]
MHAEGFLAQAFVYLAAAVVAVPIAKRLGLGSVLGYLLAGVAIGPFGLAFVGEEGADLLEFAELGVVLMLFLVGLELEPAMLWRLRGPIVGLGGLQLVTTAAAIGGVARLVGLDWRAAAAVGLIVAMSSTAIALQSLAERGLLQTAGGQSSFAVLLFQDLAVIPVLALLPLLGASGRHGTPVGAQATGDGWIATLAGWQRAVAVLAAVAAIVVAGRYLVRPMFRAIARTRLRELFTAAALLLVIGIALLMSQVGLSPALGTFLAGVVLATSEYRHELEGDIEPFKGLLLGLFFLAVGASVDFRLVVASPGAIAAAVAAVVFVKLVILLTLARRFRLSLDQALLFSVGLSQVGEFAFVLTAFASQQGVLPNEIASPLTAVVALSMATTPLLQLVHERLLAPRLRSPELSSRDADAVEFGQPVIVAGFGRFGSTVGRLLRANGVATTVLDVDSDNVESLRRLGLEVHYGDASRLDLLRAAGAERARLLVLALDSPEKTLALVATVRRHFPDLRLLARARGRDDAYALLAAGVDRVYRETLDSSLRLGVDALRELGVRAYRAERAGRLFRRHDEATLRELAALSADREGYFALARRRIGDLERLIRADLDDLGRDRDDGWDVESLRQEVASGGLDAAAEAPADR